MGEPPQIAIISEPCCHLKVYSMDSVFLHGRSLYEFFTSTIHDAKRLDWKKYGPNARQTSAKYLRFMKPLHARSMHLGRNRAAFDEIKNEVVNFAIDILNLWDRFSKHPELKEYAGLLGETRDKAIDEAKTVANQYAAYSFECPFS